MKRNSGEVIKAVLIGLAIGAIASVVHYNGYAQQRANETGQEFGVGDYVAEKPLMAIGLPVAGAAAGWGVGAILDNKASNKDIKPDVPTIQVDSGRDTVITIGGDNTTGSNDQSQPVSTSTTTTTPAAP